MILNNPNMKPTDRYLKGILEENYKGTSERKILKLPCGCTSIELDKPQDVFSNCPVCGKPFHLVWQMKPKIRGVS